jgi:hypothetical protein
MMDDHERLACAIRVRNDLFRLGAGQESLDVADDLVDELRPMADEGPVNAIVGWVAAGAFVLLLGALLLFASSCVPQAARAPLKQVDEHVQAACNGLAQLLAGQAGSPEVDKIVAATCAAEGMTRTLREMLLSQQIEAARAAGVFVPSVNSAVFEEDAGAIQAAE